MGKRINDLFLVRYIELDHECSEKLGTVSGGISEYINRLNDAKYVAGKDEVLPRLMRYRSARNRFAHEPGAIRKSDEILRSDVKWISRFRRDVSGGRDPLSRFVRKSRNHARRRRAIKILIFASAVFVTAAVATLLIIYL